MHLTLIRHFKTRHKEELGITQFLTLRIKCLVCFRRQVFGMFSHNHKLKTPLNEHTLEFRERVRSVE